MAGKKIGELTPLGRNLISTDELELSLAGSAGSRKITGAQIIGAAGGVTSVTGTAPIASSGGATPAISIANANTTTTGALTSTDWNTFNGKQAALVSGTNIKTINGTSVLGSGDLVIGGLPAWVETNATDLTLWNNGKGNVISNTSFGDSALRSNTTGARNSAYGNNSLFSVTTGSDNTAYGSSSLGNITTASFNTAIGSESMFSALGGAQNTAIGYQSLRNVGAGSNNTSVGYQALLNNTGASNSALGWSSLKTMTTGTQNVAIGYNALTAATTSINNVAIGFQAQYQSTTGASNTSIGFQANGGITTGSNNTGIGTNANTNIQTGIGNTGVGAQAGGASVGTNYSVAVGFQATAGADAIVIGTSSNSSTFTGGVIIGRSATATANNQFIVGSSSYNAGSVTTESLSSTKTWSVVINGVAQKILLA